MNTKKIEAGSVMYFHCPDYTGPGVIVEVIQFIFSCSPYSVYGASIVCTDKTTIISMDILQYLLRYDNAELL